MIRRPPTSTLFPYTTLFRSTSVSGFIRLAMKSPSSVEGSHADLPFSQDRKSTRLNYSHTDISRIPSFFFNDTSTTDIYTLSLHDALPIYFSLRLHQAGDEVAVVGRGQPRGLALLPCGIADQRAVRIGMDALELADLAVERDVRQRELEVVAGERDDLVPAQQPLRAVLRVVVAQPHVERGERRLVDALDLAVHQLEHRIGVIFKLMIVLDLRLAVAPLQPVVERIRRIGRDLAAEQIERERVVQVQLLLDRRQVDHAERAHFRDVARVGDAGVLHRIAGALHHAADAD